MARVGFIGAGKMAEAILKGIIQDGVLLPDEIGICDIQKTRVDALANTHRVQVYASNTALVDACDFVILAVKPQDFSAVLQEIAAQVSGCCVISIAAGRLLQGLEAALPEGTHVIRVMPNLACQVGAGMSVLCRGRFASDADMNFARDLFAASGAVCEAPESLFDMVTAVSGSGPAFWTQLAAYQQFKAVAAGVSENTARMLVLQTMLGTAKVLLETDQAFEAFMDAVASKGGTTAAGLDVLRASQAEQILGDMLEAAARRSVELQN